jgi:hypothetical protein
LELALAAWNLKVAHHVPTLAMTTKHQRPLYEWKICLRIFCREALTTEGKGSHC